MFHNIVNEEIKEDKKTGYERKNRIGIVDFKNLFSMSNFILYAITFMISMVSFGGELTPFAIAIFASVCSNKIPAGIVYIVTCIGTAIGFGGSGLLTYLLTSLIFIVLTLLFRTNEQEDRNEKKKLGIQVFMATFIVQARQNVFYNVFSI